MGQTLLKFKEVTLQKPTYLHELKELERIRIAEQIFANPTWYKIGPYFENHGFLITHQSLAAKYPNRGDNFLCEALLQELANRKIRINELIEALQSPDIGLNSVALYIKKQEYLFCQRAPSQDSTRENEVSGPVMIKLLIIPSDQPELNKQADKILKTMFFEEKGHVHSDHVLWKHTLATTCECYVLKLQGTRESAAIIRSTLQFVSAALFLLVNDEEDAQYLTPDLLHTKLDALPASIKTCYKLALKALDNFKHIEHAFYSVPRKSLDSLLDNVELLDWPDRDVKHKTTKRIYLCFKFSNVDKSLEEVDAATRSTVSNYIEVTSHGGGFNSINIILSGSAILPIIIELKKQKIYQALKSQDLELVSICETCIQDVIELRRKPKNDQLRTNLYNLIEQMVRDGVASSMDHKWQLQWSDNKPDKPCDMPIEPNTNDMNMKSFEKVQGPKLSSLTALERVSIAEQLFSNTKWRYIGLCFEKSHNFKISYHELKASHKEDDDQHLCEHLIDSLSEHGITIPELAEALRQKVVNMHTVADNLMQQYCASHSAQFFTDSTVSSKERNKPSEDIKQEGHKIPQQVEQQVVVNKILLIPSEETELNAQTDQILLMLGYTKLSSEGYNTLWKYSSTAIAGCDRFVLKIRNVDSENATSIVSVLAFASNVLLLVSTSEETSHYFADAVTDQIYYLSSPVQRIVRILQREQELQVYGIPKTLLTSVTGDEELLYWMIRDAKKKVHPMYWCPNLLQKDQNQLFVPVEQKFEEVTHG